MLMQSQIDKNNDKRLANTYSDVSKPLELNYLKIKMANRHRQKVPDLQAHRCF